MSATRLYRTVQGRVIGGVAGGLADFFGMDPTIVRLLFVLLVIFGGSGVLLYIILWIILPEKNPYNTYNSTTYTTPPAAGEGSGVGETYEGFEQGKPANPPYSAGGAMNQSEAPVKRMQGSLIGGVLLIVVGSLFLMERFIPRIDFSDLWPVILIAVGLILIFGNLPKKDENKSLNNNDTDNNQTF